MKKAKRIRKRQRELKRRWPRDVPKEKTQAERNIIIANNHIKQWINSTRVKPHKPKPVLIAQD